MKNYLILSLLICFSFFSCEKDNENKEKETIQTSSNYFIEAKVDGVMVRAAYLDPLYGSATVAGVYVQSMHTLTMYRDVSSTDLREWNIVINFLDLDAISLPKTISIGDNDIMLSVMLLSADRFSDSPESENCLSDRTVLGDDSFELTITSLSADNVIQGTFSGKLRQGEEERIVTEGKFIIPITRF